MWKKAFILLASCIFVGASCGQPEPNVLDLHNEQYINSTKHTRYIYNNLIELKVVPDYYRTLFGIAQKCVKENKNLLVLGEDYDFEDLTFYIVDELVGWKYINKYYIYGFAIAGLNVNDIHVIFDKHSFTNGKIVLHELIHVLSDMKDKDEFDEIVETCWEENVAT